MVLSIKQKYYESILEFNIRLSYFHFILKISIKKRGVSKCYPKIVFRKGIDTKKIFSRRKALQKLQEAGVVHNIKQAIQK